VLAASRAVRPMLRIESKDEETAIRQRLGPTRIFKK
jgi:hypothetical protein